MDVQRLISVEQTLLNLIANAEEADSVNPSNDTPQLDQLAGILRDLTEITNKTRERVEKKHKQVPRHKAWVSVTL